MVHISELGWRLQVALLVGGLAACAGAPRAGGPAWAGDPCVVGPSDAFSGATSPRGAPTAAAEATVEPGLPIVVALAGPIDPAHAPIPRTAAERLVFAQLYETLVRVTCEGRVEPVLAESWKAEEGGRRWRFTLRSDARDWEGAPVTAADVGSSWLAAGQAVGRGPGGGPETRIRSMGVEDARTLVVELDAPAPIALFAHPGLAVRTTSPYRGWPTGTGPYRPPSGEWTTRGPEDGAILSAVRDGPTLELRPLSGDALDALESGIDLVVTSDRGVIEYGAAGPFHAAPLPWNRTYLLVSPMRIGRPPESVRVDLARDALGGEARPAVGSGASFERCGLRGSVVLKRPDIRIAYPIGDASARSLAERLVALALAAGRPDGARGDASWLAEAVPGLLGSSARIRAHGLASADFAASLRAGDEAAYLVPLEHAPAVRGGEDPCALARMLAARAPWLAAIVPLVDTRSTLLLRHGLGGVVVDADGTLRLEGVRRLGGAAP